MGDQYPHSPTPKNYHSILGVPKTASLSDIGKAYKSLVMKWHPDKNTSNKEEAEAKFKAINEAYRVLTNKKREEMNEPTTPGYRRNSVNDSFFSGSPSAFSPNSVRRSKTPTPSSAAFSRNRSRRSTTPTPTDFYASISRTASGNVIQTTTPTLSAKPKESSKIATRRNNTTPIIFSQSAARKKPPPIEKRLECTLEELCHGCVKKIKITRDVITDGIIVKATEILEVKVKPGWKRGTKITFEGMGDEKPTWLPADIIFIIDEKRHSLFKREGDNLELGVEVPLVKALTGCTITIPLLGGDKMTLTFNDILYPGYEKIITGQGMPKTKDQGRRGDLRLKFLVNFPTDLSDEQRSDVFSILQDCPY
ncbi:uncharacterized protein LOC132295883 [Cornus florida]|uniref:uncharacterized protein LOC132295883 n=1 Tax=Cornus florida TaxID=4283 RepID=UPI0028A2A973|nr:uncharacterized protein LOC132295883 [Cornus florida]